MKRAFVAAVATYASAFPVAAVAARVLAAHAPRRYATDFAQPLPVVTAWQTFGSTCFATLACAVVVAGLAGIAIVRSAPDSLVERGRGARTLAIALGAIALGGAALFPFTFSSDPYAYAAYGEMAARGLDPYRLVPTTAHGPAIDAARYQWSGTYPVCVYGPLFVAFARLLDHVTWSAGLASTLTLYRAAAGIAFLASVALLDVALRGLADRRRFTIVCAYALDPVALWSVAEGHNDAFVLLVVAAAVALAARRGAWFGAGIAIGLCAVVKAPGALLAAGFGLESALLRRQPRGALGAAIGIAAAAAATIPPLLPAISHTAAHGSYDPTVSVQGFTGLVPALVIAGILTIHALRRIARTDRAGYAWLGLAAVTALPNVYPWYSLWLVPAALAGGRSRASFALYGVTICSLVRYLPDATGNMTFDALRILTVAALAPLAILIVPAEGRLQEKAPVQS